LTKLHSIMMYGSPSIWTLRPFLNSLVL